MNAAGLVREARRRAGSTQRQVAARSGMSQPTIAKIETGRADATIATVERLLAACGFELALGDRAGAGVDRTQMWELLRLRPAERVDLLRRDAEGLAQLDRARKR